jgi:hypothetical protein
MKAQEANIAQEFPNPAQEEYTLFSADNRSGSTTWQIQS